MENQYHYEIIAKAISFIRENFRNQPDLDEIAEHVHLSKFHFQRIFKLWAGISPKEFLQYTTIEHAKKSLAEGHSTLQTSYETGLSGNSRLHDLFIKIESCTPGEFQKKSKGMKILIDEFETPFGKAAIAETGKGISGLIFGSPDELIKTEHYKNAEFIKGLGTNGEIIRKYFSDWKVPAKSINLYLAGTPFQIQVWKALLQIPSSRLASYRDIAKSVKNPTAVRAVGTAVANNPVAYLIPCHRIIKNNGEFGNYHWSSERKIIINAYESAVLYKAIIVLRYYAG